MEDVATGGPDVAPIEIAGPVDAAGHGQPGGAGEELAAAPRRSPEEAERLVLQLIAAHADSLLRMARRYSLCADDAQDAYQRGLEILIRHAGRLDADRAAGWLHTVVKHEALAVNRSRRELVGGEAVDLDALEVRTAPSPEERVIGFERVARSAEALQRLKPQEVRALWLKAMGNSYQEICETTGWSYTKVNRCLAEGRKSFLARYAGIETGQECQRWAPVLSAMVDGEASAEQLTQLRPHLRNCAGCRAMVRELRGSNAPLVALFPLGGLAAADGHEGWVGVSGVVERLWHALWGDLSERAATTAFRAQAMVETAATGRAAATVASVVALAGGGMAVDGAVRDAPVAPPAAVAQAPASPSAKRFVVARASQRPVAAAARKAAGSRATRRARVRPGPRSRRTAPRRAAAAPAAASGTPSPPRVTAPPARRPAATPPPTTPSVPAAAAGPVPSGSGAGAPDGGEFSFETG
jgi:RNA polymerase sigma factor (sigma-70 family)